MEESVFDQLDLRLLAELQRDVSRSNQALAESLQRQALDCFDRYDALLAAHGPQLGEALAPLRLGLGSDQIGDALGRYRFVIDLDGHVHDERVADALLGLRRFSPSVIFLGSYPRADARQIEVVSQYGDDVFTDARDWLRAILNGEPDTR